jgi:seryl-tRNA synthetase
MNKDVMSGVAQLEQFDEELYKVSIYLNRYIMYLSLCCLTRYRSFALAAALVSGPHAAPCRVLCR